MSRPAPFRHLAGVRRLALVITTVAILFSGFVALAEPASAAAYRTTATLNLREGPGTSFAVLRTIPSGATVEVTGGAQFGFLPVTYSGTSGFASATYLTAGSGSTPDAGTTTGPTGTRYVMDGRLNLRNGPGTSYGIIAVMPSGAAVSLTGEVSNGFSKLSWNGTTGWAATQYLGTSGGSTTAPDTSSGSGSVPVGSTVTGSATTTASLNLRSGPGTSYAVKLTMPSGASVEVMGAAQSGFTPLRYNGTTGWSSSAYLSSGGSTPTTPTTPTAPTHPGSGTTVATKVTTAALNMRTGPGTSYTVITTLAAGTSVAVNGSAQNGFVPITASGRQGWVSSSYLADPSTAPTSPGTDWGDNDGTYTEQEIINIIYAAADKWGQPRTDMLRVARCESGLNPLAVNRSSGASGLFQFMPSTFAFTPNGKAGESIFNPISSADAAGWMWANGMRNHWSCQ